MKTLKQLALIITISATFTTSNAQAAIQGFYGGMGLGLASINDSIGNSDITSETTGWGFQNISLNFVGGYNLTSYLGIEAIVGALGVEGWNEQLGGTVTALPAAIDLIGYVPLFHGFDFFAKFGTASTKLEYATVSGQTPIDAATNKAKTYGYGIEFSISEMQSYRIGVDHFDLTVTPGTSISTNYVNITGIAHF